MIKKYFFSSLILFSFLWTNAQFKQISAGPAFDEPSNGFAKLLLLKNGSVIFFRIGTKDGIDVRIYDATHKEIASNTLSPAYQKLKDGSLEGIFEVNGDAVLMISEVDGKVPVLYRLIIDGVTSKLKKEEKIAELKKQAIGMGFSGGPIPDFYVSNDPGSDCYAVALFNSFEPDRNKKIEIVLYGNDHKEISKAFFNSWPDEKYQYLEFVSMAVIGSEKVSVLINGYHSGDKGRDVILATLDKAATQVSFDDLHFMQDIILEYGIIRYNPYTKKLIVAGKINAGKNSKDVYSFLILPNTEKDKAEKIMQSGLNEKVNQGATNIFWENYKFSGIPVDMYINKDGGFSITYEEQAVVMLNYSRTTTSHVETYRIGVATYNRSGELTGSYIIPKNFWIDGERTLTGGGFGSQYKKFSYINGPEKSYILINDTRRNIERQENNKPIIQIQGVGDCDAFYFPLTGSNPVPQRKYLFGESNDVNERNLAPLGVSVYDDVNDEFIVLRLNKQGRRNKTVNVIWLKPQ